MASQGQVRPFAKARKTQFERRFTSHPTRAPDRYSTTLTRPIRFVAARRSGEASPTLGRFIAFLHGWLAPAVRNR